MQKKRHKKAISFNIVVNAAKVIKAIAWLLIAISVTLKSCQ